MTQTERYVDSQRVSGEVLRWGLVCIHPCIVHEQRYNKGDLLQGQFYRTRMAALLARNNIHHSAPFDAVLLEVGQS